MKSNRLPFEIGSGSPPIVPAAGPAFVVCPIQLSGPALLLWQQMQQLHLYQAAYAQAQAAQPPRHERELFTCWN